MALSRLYQGSIKALLQVKALKRMLSAAKAAKKEEGDSKKDDTATQVEP